jgi:hypothetical protein
MATVGYLQNEVGVRLRRGDSFSAVETDVIEPSGLSEEGKSALWLYGWAHLEKERTRYQERQSHIRRQARRRGAPSSGD